MPGPTPEDLREVKYWLEDASEEDLEKLRHHGSQIQGNLTAFNKKIDELKERKWRKDKRKSLQSQSGV